MASTPDFVEYVCEQIAGIGEIRSKKMFGEYMIYVNDKPILLVCDNIVFVKQLDCVAAEMKEAASGIPYPGARPHFILDIDDAESSKRIARILEAATPVPKPRGKKSRPTGADKKNKAIGSTAKPQSKDKTK